MLPVQRVSVADVEPSGLIWLDWRIPAGNHMGIMPGVDAAVGLLTAGAGSLQDTWHSCDSSSSVARERRWVFPRGRWLAPREEDAAGGPAWF